MVIRSAQPGDIFILLLPEEKTQPVAFPWQRRLQAQYGGQCTQPLHVSLQRFTCADPSYLTAFKNTLQAAISRVKPLSLEGIALQPLFSNFRQNYILKCRLQQNEAINSLAAMISQQLQQHNLTPDFPWCPELVTVLEDIDRTATDEILLHSPETLFVGSTLLLSRVVARNEYLPLWQWQLQG